MSAPFSGRPRSWERQKKGIDLASPRVNEAVGVNGRKLRLIAARRRYEPEQHPGRDK